MRIFLGFLIAGFALGGAVWLHDWRSEVVHLTARASTSKGGSVYAQQGTFVPLPGQSSAQRKRRADWQDPLAVVIALAGVGAGIALVASSRGTRTAGA